MKSITNLHFFVHKSFVPALVWLLTLGLMLESAQAESILDQSHLNFNNAHSVRGSFEVVQTFTPSISGSLLSVEVQVTKYVDFFGGGGSFGNLYLDILTTDFGGSPTTTIRGSAVLSPLLIPNSGGIPPLTSFLLTSPPVLNAGELYAIRLTSPETLSFDRRYEWFFSAQSGSGGGTAPDYYTRGQMFRDNGSGLNLFPGDTVFQTYMQAVPEPTTLTMVSFGLAGWGVVARRRCYKAS